MGKMAYDDQDRFYFRTELKQRSIDGLKENSSLNETYS